MDEVLVVSAHGCWDESFETGARNDRKRSETDRLRACYSSGAKIPQTGIYQVVHRKEHGGDADVVLIRGDEFPKCDACGGGVEFRVIRTAAYLFEDSDFR